MVRAQGGTEAAVRLGLFSRDFYPGQHDRARASTPGFVAQGYFMPCFTDGRGRAGARADRDAAGGWVSTCAGSSRDEFDAINPRGARADARGVVRPGRRLHRPAAQRARLHRRARSRPASRCASGRRSPGCVVDGRPGDRRAHLGRRRSRPSGSCSPAVRSWPPSGGRAGVRIPSGGARHQVVVTEPHPDLAPDRLPMVFDVASGIYWRPEEGGVMWGMSNPDEAPGEATRVRLGLLRADARADGRRCCR